MKIATETFEPLNWKPRRRDMWEALSEKQLFVIAKIGYGYCLTLPNRTQGIHPTLNRAKQIAEMWRERESK